MEMAESIHSWNEVNNNSSSFSGTSSSSTSSRWDASDMLRLAELQQRLTQVVERAIDLSQMELSDLYTELAQLQGRLVEFETRNVSIANEVMQEARDDNHGKSDDDASSGSSSASTTSSERCENEMLRAVKRALLLEDLEQAMRARNVSVQVESDHSNIPESITSYHSNDNDNDNDDDDNSSIGTKSTEHQDDFAPTFRFSEDPPPKAQPTFTPWKTRILRNVDIAGVLIGISMIMFRLRRP